MLRKQRLPFLWIFIVWLSFQLPAQAAATINLYQAIVSVNSQNENERQKVLPEAMAQVLIKLTANPRLVEKLNMRNYLKQAANYIQQYHYINSPINSAKFLLVINFNATAIDALLQNLGQEKWKGERPLIIVWLASETNGSHDSVDETSSLGQQLKLNAEQHGLSIIFPSYDLNDMQQVTMDDIWAPNLKPIMQATQRYQADKILVGRITRSGSQSWGAQWQFGIDQQWQTITARGDNTCDVIQQSLDQVLTQLRSVDAAPLVDNSAKQKVEILVNGITGLADYQRVLAYLQSLPGVAGVQVLNVGTDQVTFNIGIDNKVDNLLNAIEQGGVVYPRPKTEQGLLEYQLKS